MSDPTKPVRGILDPYEAIVVEKIVPGIPILGGPKIAAEVEPGGQRPFRDAGKDVGYCDNFRVENGKTVCDVHLNAYRPE